MKHLSNVLFFFLCLLSFPSFAQDGIKFEHKSWDEIKKIAKQKKMPIFVDVYATWCGPCKYEIPYLKNLEHEFSGKNIQFVSISLDKIKNRAVWEDFIESEQLTGVQLIGEDEFNSDFAKKYAINAIPHFILIDPEGNIVNANAPRPSDPEIQEFLREHI